MWGNWDPAKFLVPIRIRAHTDDTVPNACQMKSVLDANHNILEGVYFQTVIVQYTVAGELS